VQTAGFLNLFTLTPFVLPEIVKGIVTQWSGSILAIPSGWALCDGTNGTPDLRDKFIPGAGTTYNPADSAGSVNHPHTFTGDGHGHLITSGFPINGGLDYIAGTNLESAAGTTDAGSSLPTYYALAYIMKL